MPIFDPSSIVIGDVEANRKEPSPGNNLNGSGSTSVTGPGSFVNDNGLYKSPYVYAGYTDAVTGANDGHIVLHYDGIYNTRNSDGSIQHTSSSLTTWSDLSGHNNDGSLRKGSWTDRLSVDGKTTWVGSYDSYTASWNDKQEESETGDASWGNNSVTLSNNSYFVKESPNNMPLGNSSYTMEIVFDFYENQMKAGLIGLGVYNEAAIQLDEDKYGNPVRSFMHQFYDTTWDKKVFFPEFENHYGYMPWDDTKSIDLSNQFTKGTSANGMANALRTNGDPSKNTKADGLTSYYYGVGDCERKECLSNGNRYTVTLRNNNNSLQFFVNGSKVGAPFTKIPNTFNSDVSVGATFWSIKQLYVQNVSDETDGILDFVFEYSEFLNGTIYSARIYNRALTDLEISTNYTADIGRF